MANKAPDTAGLRPWEKGKSGNPGGRPKWKLLSDALRGQLSANIRERFTEEQVAKLPKRLQKPTTTVAEVVADSLITEALGGDGKVRAAREIMDRTEGRVPLPLIGSSDEPISINMICHIPRPDRSKNMAARWLVCHGSTVEDAEDAVQSAALKALRTASVFRGESKFTSWFLRIAINERAQVRRNRTHARLRDALPLEPHHRVTEPTQETEAIDAELIAIVRMALADLSPIERRAIELRLEDHTLREIAAAEGITLAAAKARLYHARDSLRQLLCSNRPH